MGCINPLNNAWDSTPDYKIVYTGKDLSFAEYKIEQGSHLQYVIETFATAIETLDNKEYYTPFVQRDNTLTIDMTATQLNQKFPSAPLMATVYNTDEGFEYIKLSSTEWKFQIIDIRT